MNVQMLKFGSALFTLAKTHIRDRNVGIRIYGKALTGFGHSPSYWDRKEEFHLLTEELKLNPGLLWVYFRILVVGFETVLKTLAARIRKQSSSYLTSRTDCHMLTISHILYVEEMTVDSHELYLVF